ncbi:MAG: hypothetical protein BJ554DRAFT_4916 [Olpidium bornovanus]|uniref:Uncharacterized protein n=1 Tax=Olpidium bornovanus TaxID=278681 RepID=A0A8H7ZZZ0_9FUNG|nr:MAG: hypothetical protein BJ554DRAFT_4916 [Olpidium bornovanus]
MLATPSVGSLHLVALGTLTGTVVYTTLRFFLIILRAANTRGTVLPKSRRRPPVVPDPAQKHFRQPSEVRVGRSHENRGALVPVPEQNS